MGSKVKKKQNMALILVPAAVVLLALFSSKAEAAPPLKYVCPYCGDSFATYEELVAHVQSVHPGERIPLEIEWT